MRTLQPDTRTARVSARSKRELVLTVATRRFAEHGYERTRWAAVAEEVGVGLPALYHYFESKTHCLLTIMRRELDNYIGRFVWAIDDATTAEDALRVAVVAAVQGTPSDILRRRITKSYSNILALPCASDGEEEERQRARQLVKQIESRWASIIKFGCDEGEFDPALDPLIAARVVLGTVTSAWGWYRPGGSLNIDGLAAVMSDAAVALMKTADGGARAIRPSNLAR